MSRIEGQGPPDVVIPGLNPSPQLGQANKAKQPDAAKTRHDEVDVSSRAKTLNRIAAVVDTVPDIRTEKVASIKQAIDAGTYSVKGEDVADALIRDRLSDEVR